MEISKELLSEALNYKVTAFSHNGYTYGKIGKNFMLHINPAQRADRPSSCVIPKESINIYELAHRCKEWALSKGYEIVSVADTTKIYKNKYEIYNVTNKKLYCLENFFEACEYILKELK